RRAGVGAHDDDHVSEHDGVEGLRAGRFAQRGLEAIAGGRVADARAGVDVVGAEGRAHQLLHQVGFFVGAARRGQAADGVASILGLNALEFGGGMVDGLVPADLAPRLVDAGADHGLGDAVLVGGVAPREASFDAGVAAVGLAVLPGHHAHDLIAFHFGLEGAAHAAVCARGDYGVLGLAHHDDGFLDQRGRGARLHAGAAGHAVAVEEGVVLACGDARGEALAVDGERERALDFVTGAYAAAAYDAFG